MRNMVIRNLGLQPKGKGVAVDLLKTVVPPYNPSVKPTPVTTTYNGSGVRVNYTEAAYRNTLIIYGDFQIYLSPVLLDGTECPMPQKSDTMIFNGETVKVINVSPFNDNGIDCGWKVQVRYG